MLHSENSRQTQQKRILNSLKIAKPEHEEQRIKMRNFEKLHIKNKHQHKDQNSIEFDF